MAQRLLLSLSVQNFRMLFFCYLIYTVNDPTLQILHKVCTDVPLSSFSSNSTFCCMDNDTCLHLQTSTAVLLVGLKPHAGVNTVTASMSQQT